MRLGFGWLVLAAFSVACSDNRAARLAADWGCGPVEGLAAISGDKAPTWVLVGEMTETAEAPAAITDIACHLAASGEPLFVGVRSYYGGASDAELKMRMDLAALAKKGAPIILATIGGEDHPYDVHDKSRSEKAWAGALMQRVAAAGARRALLFLSRADAISEPIPPGGDRFAGYSPMPVFLEGGVVSLEVGGSAFKGASGPAICVYPRPREGFTGTLALPSLTRPALTPPVGQAADQREIAATVMADEDRPAGSGTEAKKEGWTAPEDLDRQDGRLGPISEAEREKLLRDLFRSIP